MVKSPIKIIDSGTAPTTENLGEGQIAFGTVDGATKLYGSDGTTVSELVGGSGQGPQGPAGEDGITPTIGDNGNWFLGETDTGKPSRGEQGPQGEPGQDGAPGTAGAPGAAATITVGETTTGEAGTQASVTNSGTTSAAVLNFTIPKGAKGDKGDTGDTGPAGTTTFAGLTDQPTDNAALKTALDAKADQTAVDSLTTTVNGKVSSVTAGEGISITGTATEPVISATGGTTDTGWLDVGSSGLNYLIGPFTIPADKSLRIRKFGNHVTLAGTIQATGDINNSSNTNLLAILGTDSHYGELKPVANFESTVYVSGVLVAVFGIVTDDRAFAVQLVPSVAISGGTPTIHNGDVINFQVSWDTEA